MIITPTLEEEIRRISTPEQWDALQEMVATGPMTLPEVIEAIVQAPGGSADKLGIDVADMSATVAAFALKAARMRTEQEELDKAIIPNFTESN